jgi:hypothetical protein
MIDQFQQGVRDFIYLPQYQTCFVAQSDMNIVTRLDSYFTNVSNFPRFWPKYLLNCKKSNKCVFYL